MAGIIDFPTVVQEALQHFGDLLPNEPQRRHFAEYLTGLFVAERKNVSALSREFPRPTTKPSLTAFLTKPDWTVGRLTNRGLTCWHQAPSTRSAATGAFPSAI